MRAYILSIGDELVSGLTVNTNCAWLSQQLTGLGIGTSTHLTVGDEPEPIRKAIQEACDKCDVLLISGGLGPTEDDLTRQMIAEALGEKLVEDGCALEQLEHWFKSRNRVMSPSNRVQAQRPESARCLENTCGTAPGLAATKGKTRIFAMPGVPREMKEMFTRSVLPEIKQAAGDRVTLVTKINTYGMGESILGEKIKDLMKRGANPAVGTTVHDGIVSVRIYATGTRDEAIAMTQKIREQVYARLGALIFGENEATIEGAVAALLKERRETIATAESCTGGTLGALLTDIAGSSTYFLRGWVTYSNESKTDELGVPAALIAEHGAVSEPVVRAMAEGARKRAGTSYGIGITGIAGPDGGTEEKPVGTVWLAVASDTGTEARRIVFPGDRKAVRLRASQMALALLRWRILDVGFDTVTK